MKSAYLKILTEAGPLLVFFFGNYFGGIMMGTAALMVSTFLALIVSYSIERQVPIMPLVSCVFVGIFGGLTLWLHDDMFIKLKPTIVNLFFGVVLIISYFTKRYFLKIIMGEMVPLKEEGWRVLTFRWAMFFFVMAGLNEFVWRTFGTDFWVDFKVFGVMPITIVFTLLQVRVIVKYQDA